MSAGAGFAGSLFIPTPVKSLILPKTMIRQEKSLILYNTHTGEHLPNFVYWAEGRYIPSALKSVSRFFRDWRTGEVTGIDPKLLDVLHALKMKLGHTRAFDIICGYRSPKTNQMLCQKSQSVAKRSLHMQGRAVDIRFRGPLLGTAHRAACALKAGGVGLYPRSSDRFIHVDVRPQVVRWTG